MEQIKPFAAITPEHIQDWKAKYGDVLSEITSGDAKFVVKKPNRRVIELIGQFEQKNDFIAISKTLISNCVLGGDMDEMEADGTIYNGIMKELHKLFEVQKTSLKKL